MRSDGPRHRGGRSPRWRLRSPTERRPVQRSDARCERAESTAAAGCRGGEGDREPTSRRELGQDSLLGSIRGLPEEGQPRPSSTTLAVGASSAGRCPWVGGRTSAGAARSAGKWQTPAVETNRTCEVATALAPKAGASLVLSETVAEDDEQAPGGSVIRLSLPSGRSTQKSSVLGSPAAAEA